jgi:hypothetical protein
MISAQKVAGLLGNSARFVEQAGLGVSFMVWRFASTDLL